MFPKPHASIPAFVSLVLVSRDLAPWCAMKPRTSAELRHQEHYDGDDGDDADNEDHEDYLPHEVLSSKMMDEFVPWNLGWSLRFSRCVCRLRPVPRNWFARISAFLTFCFLCVRVFVWVLCACVSAWKAGWKVSFPYRSHQNVTTRLNASKVCHCSCKLPDEPWAAIPHSLLQKPRTAIAGISPDDITAVLALQAMLTWRSRCDGQITCRFHLCWFSWGS